MKHIILILVLALCTFHPAFSQSSSPRLHTLHLDLLGPGGAGSVGYACNISPRRQRPGWFTAGISLSAYRSHYDGSRNTFAVLNPELGWVLFGGNHHLELGLIPQIKLQHSPEDGWGAADLLLSPAFRAGWHMQKPGGRISVRAGVSGWVYEAYEIMAPLVPWPYAGIGFQF